MEATIPFKPQSRARSPFIDPSSELIPPSERESVLELGLSHIRLGVWIDEFASTLELLDYCQKELRKLQKQKNANREEGHTKSILPRMFGSAEEKKKAFKEDDRLRRKQERIERRMQGFREWAVIAAKGAALALHDFGRAHIQITDLLAKRAKSVDDMIPAATKKEVTKLFHDEFDEIYAAIRDGISHMQEKFGPGPKGRAKHLPKGEQELMYGLAITGRRFSTTWKGKTHSIMLDNSTAIKMERVYHLWAVAFRCAIAAINQPNSERKVESLRRLKTI